MFADTSRARPRAQVKPGPAAPHGALRATENGGRKSGTTTPGSLRAAMPSVGLSARQAAEKPDQNKKEIIKRCHVGAPVLEMPLETEAAALLRRLVAGGSAASRRLSRWRFPFNGLFTADASHSGVLGGAGRGGRAAQSAGREGGAKPRGAEPIGWRRGAGDAHPSSSAREAGRGGARGQ